MYLVSSENNGKLSRVNGMVIIDPHLTLQMMRVHMIALTTWWICCVLRFSFLKIVGFREKILVKISMGSWWVWSEGSFCGVTKGGGFLSVYYQVRETCFSFSTNCG
jgi:hypothetical protein